MNEFLYQQVKKSNIQVNQIFEVGVFFPQTSNVLGFINDGSNVTLVEPDPICIKAIIDEFGKMTNVKLLQLAIFDPPGEISLYRTNASTFVSTLEMSPALINDNYKPNEKDRFIAKAVKFDEIDPGDIDLISIDVEGADWYILKDMVSRPKIISVETHAKKYVNPNLELIENWMNKNDYIVWYKLGSDTVFIKKELFTEVLLPKEPNKLIKKLKKIFGF